VRAAASTDAAKGTAGSSCVTLLPRLAPNPPGSTKSFCQSIMMSAADPAGQANGEGMAAATAPAQCFVPAAAVAATQGLTLGHFPAQWKHFMWNRALFRGGLGGD